MSLTVKQRAETVATLRHVEVSLMEMLARWVPTTPMMEVKVLFGRHIWETAQHADILGGRTYELRAPKHFSLAPTADYAALLQDISALPQQAQRVSAFYDVILPDIIRRAQRYIAETDTLLDEPTVRILRRIIMDSEGMIVESRQLRNAQPTLEVMEAGWSDALSARAESVHDFVAGYTRPTAEVAVG